MATTKPRITITLSQRQYAVLKSISDNSGQPMSAFVNELLEQTLPVLERMAESFRKIKAAQDEQKKRIVDELDQAQSAVEPMLGQVLGQFDLFMTRLEQAAGAGSPDARQRAAVPAPAASSTPVTNRGVTPTPGKDRKPAPGKASSRSGSPRQTSKSRGG